MLLNQNRALAVLAQYKAKGKSAKQYAAYLNSVNILPVPDKIITIQTLEEHIKQEKLIKARLLNAYRKTTIT